MDSKICPRCGEENPSEAVMCWSCYTPLQDDGLQTERHFPSLDWWRDRAATAVPYLLVAGLVSSGWWRGKTRFWVLGTCVGVVAWGFAREKRDQSRQKQEAIDQGDPIERIGNTILFYALKDRATRIRLTRQEYGIQVEYEIGGQWIVQMKIPGYVWEPLRDEFVQRARQQPFAFSQEQHSAHFRLRILIEPPHEEIMLTTVEARSNETSDSL
ncbi:MAG: hypothetical protein KY445_10280 [Armatimonadetes bacterium]|nr:hypothetical protein [Armatimonadota bacterium]